jgi:hypothetical protein
MPSESWSKGNGTGSGAGEVGWESSHEETAKHKKRSPAQMIRAVVSIVLSSRICYRINVAAML